MLWTELPLMWTVMQLQYFNANKIGVNIDAMNKY